MPCLLHIIANQNGSKIYNHAESVANRITFDPCVAVAMAIDTLMMDGHNLAAAKIKEIAKTNEIPRCDEYDLNLLFEDPSVSLGMLDLLAWIYALWCDCNMNTPANQLADWIDSLA